MGFILSHIQHNFLRCSHTEDISTLDSIINEKRMFVKCHNKLFIILMPFAYRRYRLQYYYMLLYQF